MSDNKLVKTITDTATLTDLAAGISWISRPQLQCLELCQIHRSYGWKHRPETVSSRPKDSSRLGLKK